MELHFHFRDWIYSLTVGILVVSYWRSSWTLLDIVGCDQPTTATLANGDTFCFALTAALDPDSSQAQTRFSNATYSYAAGLLLLFTGVTLVILGFWLPDRKTLIITPKVGIYRFVITYILGASAVNIWRGIWYWLDAWILPNNPLASYWTSSLVGAAAAFATYTGGSLLAPPALFLLDGPDTDPPPIAVTALNAHFSVILPSGKDRPIYPMYMTVLDILFSFGFVPFAVVSFWRGSWLLLDHYLWGFTASDRDVRVSLIWSMLLFILCIWLTSEPVVGTIDRKLGGNTIMLGILGRVRNYILAWGTVSLWRCFWLFWDEYLGGSTLLSVSLGHSLSVIGLLSMGCMSCINAPASTIGVDSVPDPGCEDDPLFSMVPLPWETLYAFGMFRQIDRSQECFQQESSHGILKEPIPASTGDIEMTKGTREEAVGASTFHEDNDDGDDDSNIQVPAATLQGDDGDNLRRDPQEKPVGVDPKRRSYRPGLQRSNAIRRLDLIQPGLRRASMTNYLQRPCDDNIRMRSRLFKNRGNNTRNS